LNGIAEGQAKPVMFPKPHRFHPAGFIQSFSLRQAGLEYYQILMEDSMNHSSQNLVLVVALLLASLICASMAWAAVGDTLYVGTGNGQPGETGTFSIMLKNVTPVKGLLFTLKDVPDSLHKAAASPVKRAVSFSVTADSAGGTYKVLMIPKKTGSLQIAAGNDTILNVAIGRINAKAIGGTKATISLINVSVADPSNQSISYGVKSGIFWFGEKGDVKYNAVVDLFDVLRMIDIAISRPPVPTDYERWAGDFDNSGSIDVIDIGQAIDLAIGGLTAAAPIGDDAEPAAGSVRIEMPLLPQYFCGEIQLPVNLKASAPVAGMQLAIKLDRKQYQLSAPAITKLSQEMTLVSKVMDDELHILLCSTNGQVMPAGEGTVLTIPISVQTPLKESSEIKIEHALAATAGAARLQAFYGQSNGKETVVPQSFALFQNSPNPFNMSTTITYDIPNQSQGTVPVKLAIYNTQGQLVRTLEEQSRTAGRYTVSWNGMDDFGNTVASGVYFYKLSAGKVVLSKKLAIMK